MVWYGMYLKKRDQEEEEEKKKNAKIQKKGTKENQSYPTLEMGKDLGSRFDLHFTD